MTDTNLHLNTKYIHDNKKKKERVKKQEFENFTSKK
jgi:hypothetical protein